MDTGRNRRVGPGAGNAPEIEMAETIRRGANSRRVVEIIVILRQPFGEIGIVPPTVDRKQPCAKRLVVDFAERVLGVQRFAERAVVGAEPGVGFDRGAVGVPGVDVGRNRAAFVVVRITVDDVQDRVAAGFAEKGEVREHVIDGDLAGRRGGEGVEAVFVEGDDAFAGAKEVNDFGVVAGKRAGPAGGVGGAGEAGGEEILEAGDGFEQGGDLKPET